MPFCACSVSFLLYGLLPPPLCATGDPLPGQGTMGGKDKTHLKKPTAHDILQQGASQQGQLKGREG